MCMVVYVASGHPLPTTPWDQTRPNFHVTGLSGHAVSVRRWFSKPYVYYVGSHEGCGCGFQYGEYEGYEEEADLRDKHNSRRQLTEFLTAALRDQSEVELFACWSGDESTEPEFREQLRPADLVQERTFFRERELMVISNHDPGPAS